MINVEINLHQGNSILVAEFPSLLEALEITHFIDDHTTLIEIIEFTTGGAAVLFSSSNNCKELKKKLKKNSYAHIEQPHPDLLKSFYNLKPFKIHEQLILFPKIKFIDLFLVLNEALKKGHDIIKIRSQRTFAKNSLILSSNGYSQKDFLTDKKKYRAQRVTVSPSLRLFFDISKS